MRSVPVFADVYDLVKAEWLSHIFRGPLLAFVLSRLPAVWHLLLICLLAVVLVFWVGILIWIAVRLARTLKTDQEEPLP
jgi:hypothetical protein